MPSIVAAVALVSGLLPVALAQTPLASQHFTYTALPYQADPNDGERGRQWGYNICNSTTENQESLCQTAIINSIDDFCLWGPPEPDSLIGNVEGESVAWCTKPGYGTRRIPDGALTGVQFMKTPDYIQVTGFIKQELINIQADDSGGELDPHGADQRGNPLGGLLFSNAWGGGFTQAVEWHNFMGGGVFCLKACDPAGPNAAHFCEHIFDRIGCKYNAPAAYQDGVFESCLGENQDFPGIYTDAAGAVQTYTQPPESLGPISTIPYEPRIPASSSCTPYQSAALYSGAPSATVTHASSSGTGTGTRTGTRSTSATRSASSSSSTSTSGASPRTVMSVGALAGAAFLAAFAL
ncbi:hypothetical protein CPB86DRAFT_831363 [Serendipita vermifera]|nr:hypothetical protein CPB86DRAFT_831363 [Serendipita vermifera]